MEGVSGCDVIEFTRNLKEVPHSILYRLEIYVQLNRTILTCIKETEYSTAPWGPDETIIVDVKNIINGVNPDNVKDKIKNLLLFL